MKLFPAIFLFLLSVVGPDAAFGASLTANVLGCKNTADAAKIELLRSKNDKPGLEKTSKAMVASRACINFARGTPVEIDQKQTPLSCVRLAGDLSCYWLSNALINVHPEENPSAKGAGGQNPGGRHRGGMQPGGGQPSAF